MRRPLLDPGGPQFQCRYSLLDQVRKLVEGRVEPSSHGTSRVARRPCSDAAQGSGLVGGNVSRRKNPSCQQIGFFFLLTDSPLFQSPLVYSADLPVLQGSISHARHTSGGLPLPNHTLLPSLCCPGRGQGDFVPGGVESPALG